MLPLPVEEYVHRVYAGVLGKCIGVYLGRPIEGWTYDRIQDRYGEIRGNLNPPDRPVVVTDDDISGTFTFIRALDDCGCNPDITPNQIACAWRNYLIEGKTTLWWGGRGNSTEHTAYLNLCEGISPPESGSATRNGSALAQGVGAQIFIDGWAMVAPGDPERAADLARRAAGVSHDGEAIYGAQVVAAVESGAFVESRLATLLDTAMALIPRESTVLRMMTDLREWHAGEREWRKTRERLDSHYGYENFPGTTPLIPNLGVIILGLLYGEDDFDSTLSIVNSCGWDTDCNSGNAGCIMGIKNGLSSIDDGYDWRGPVRDRLFVTSAEAGGVVTDALTEAYRLANMGVRLAGSDALRPKGGARYHFELPGSVQGFTAESHSADSQPPDEATSPRVSNVSGHSRNGSRSLAFHHSFVAAGDSATLSTPTGLAENELSMPVYDLMGSPTLYPGQIVRAGLDAEESNAAAIVCRLYAEAWDTSTGVDRVCGAEVMLDPGEYGELVWRIPASMMGPLARVGVELQPSRSRARGPATTAYLDYLTWDGQPDCSLYDEENPSGIRSSWVRAVDFVPVRRPFRMVQNRGRGMLIQGASSWTSYRLSATLSVEVAQEIGVGVCVQGMRRYYAFLLTREGKAVLEKHADSMETLAEQPLDVEFRGTHTFVAEVTGNRISASIDCEPVISLQDPRPLERGAISLICTEGCVQIHNVAIKPWV